MNCKPNQMARVIATKNTLEHGTADKIIKTVSVIGVTRKGFPAWTYEGRQFISKKNGLEIEAIGDNILRPIDNPGDDAVDEMVGLVGPAPKVGRKVTA